MKYLMRIAYDGSKFHGFQRLNEENSVQAKIEEALSIINKKDVSIKGAGRTDRGVHALDQCVSFDLDVNIDENGLLRGVNSLVEPYIYVKDVKVVDDDFHARFNVKKKKYKYVIKFSDYNPLEFDYVFFCKYKLDIDKMKEVAKLYEGVHDFHNFVSGERENTECIIYGISFELLDNRLEITFEGKSFYRYMVRNLVGAMIEVGRGKVSFDYVKEMLESKKELSCFTAPASGLYLINIEY